MTNNGKLASPLIHPPQPSKAAGTPLLSRTVLSEQIKDFIVELILSGELKPGERVVESGLARRLGVSQAPVREAVRDLILLGFLEVEPYKGASVRSFSPEDLFEVFTVRAALEALAARFAASRLTEADVKVLEELLNQMIEAARRRDRDELPRLDNQFHETIMQISGNKTLYQLWQTLHFGFWTMLTIHLDRFDLEFLAARHRDVLDALITRNPETAAEAMKHHIEDLGQPVSKDAS